MSGEGGESGASLSAVVDDGLASSSLGEEGVGVADEEVISAAGVRDVAGASVPGSFEESMEAPLSRSDS